MCGITGEIRLQSGRPELRSVERMARTLAHRGPDGEGSIELGFAAFGHRLEGGAGSRNDVWLFDPDGADATPSGGRNLSGPHDLMPGSGMSSDVTRGDTTPLIASKGGRWLYLSAPIDELLSAEIHGAAPPEISGPRQYDDVVNRGEEFGSLVLRAVVHHDNGRGVEAHCA